MGGQDDCAGKRDGDGGVTDTEELRKLVSPGFEVVWYGALTDALKILDKINHEVADKEKAILEIRDSLEVIRGPKPPLSED